ncbi:Uu.00g106270.m01.CDS01 [Anthostomella pinea]|uniref:Uu.00g106270.m01.CDS01 n=1 Tax=Anthostomella pinea TaxID=933095 RepID=A0AAI8VF30_9PEZI|nr:Uu.00g106270.m01.CDS01 [Anthostomella pinea]
MRLLHVYTLELHEFIGHDIPKYAILSHTWGVDEVTLQDMRSGNAGDRLGYEKITLTCQQAKRDGLEWAWIDTCCIDKTSSAELSEAINSMYQWYGRSQECYAYLDDEENTSEASLRASRWFMRGWTLQELIAPKRVKLYGHRWTFIGTRKRWGQAKGDSVSADIQGITAIPQELLEGEKPISAYSAAQKMSWAAFRSCTRIEDVAYSMLGLFGINLPLMYGEGQTAFTRLQAEILNETDNQSLLAWTVPRESPRAWTLEGAFARSPADFAHSGHIEGNYFDSGAPSAVTNRGLQINLHISQQNFGLGSHLYSGNPECIVFHASLNAAATTSDDSGNTVVLIILVRAPQISERHRLSKNRYTRLATPDLNFTTLKGNDLVERMNAKSEAIYVSTKPSQLELDRFGLGGIHLQDLPLDLSVCRSADRNLVRSPDQYGGSAARYGYSVVKIESSCVSSLGDILSPRPFLFLHAAQRPHLLRRDADVVWSTQYGSSFFTSPSLAQDTSNDNTTTTSSSVFVTPQQDLAFAINVPSNSSTDLFFSLVFPIHISWGAIGLGSNKMAGSLILMAYASSSGQNVTISPRLAHGHSEPVHAPEIDIEALPGTGLVNETTYVFNGRCGNCRTWTNGQIDVSSTAQNMLYATGDQGDMKSYDAAAPLRMHWSYGTFTMDLVHATGPGGVPTITADEDTRSVAAVQGLSKTGKRDSAAVAHAVIMVPVFVGIYPLGILVLRLGDWVRWHAVNQGVAVVLFIVGAGLGFKISGSYNRSKKFNTAHQVIGILIFIAIFAQFALGFLNHRAFKKTQKKTKMAPIHVWLGRLIIVLGVVNGFTGFPLALSTGYDYVLAGLVLVVFPIMVILIITKKFIQKRWKKSKESSVSDEPNGYNMQPWQGGEGQGQGQGQGQTIHIHGGRAVETLGVPAPAYQPRSTGAADLGPQQNAREYV